MIIITDIIYSIGGFHLLDCVWYYTYQRIISLKRWHGNKINVLKQYTIVYVLLFNNTERDFF